MEIKTLETDILIIGGGTAGCYAAYTLGRICEAKVLIAEKANIKRSGCLAAGVNAINAYIVPGKTPKDYVEYAKEDAKGIVREDLLLSMSEGLNEVTKELEHHGLVILKDENGNYQTRGNRNIKINGENIKPILADMAMSKEQISVLNHVNITDYLVEHNRIYGAVGFHVDQKVAYVIRAKAVLIATGGAAGLYRPNNPGFSRHKMWYPPFNTGAGYAMGIRAGAEMTTLEMRFVALRCKDTIAPTGTIAQGVGAGQINAFDENYEKKYGLATCERVYGTTKERKEGRGPCYLETIAITKEQEADLYKAYLNMAPSQTLRWIESGKGPAKENVEIEGTEPYIVGGHTASGYWIDNHRQTTIQGLFAAGDVAGGAPQKYVTGAMVEGKIAAEYMAEYLKETKQAVVQLKEQADSYLKEYELYFKNQNQMIDCEQMEEAMQKIMDRYAGGISTDYQFHERYLKIATEQITQLENHVRFLQAKSMDDLLQIYELKERLTVCLSLIKHMKTRKETRWPGFTEYADYPRVSHNYEVYINSYLEDGKRKMRCRKLVGAQDWPVVFRFDDAGTLIYGGDSL
ncbi:MAG: adenylyl-sulfate reductase subunit alpha [Eubacterium sp.]|nr:adenylyl-sulfate reductase subunit alpha [Eubacterium sp.]